MTTSHIRISAATTTTTTTTVGPSCPTCGAIVKSGKLSCCARGGSWFENCGATGNTKFEHTWYEGIQACKAQQSASQQLDAVAQNSNSSSNDNNDAANSQKVIVAARMFAPTSADTQMSGETTSAFIQTPTDASVSNTIPSYDAGKIMNNPINDPDPSIDKVRAPKTANRAEVAHFHSSASSSIPVRGWEKLIIFMHIMLPFITLVC